MNNLISKIKTKILKNKNNIIFVAFFVLLFSADNAFAADATPADGSDVVKWVNGMMSVVTSGLGLMTGLVMKFLEPGWTSGTVFGLNDILKNIWVMISNIVYFVFAFLLISIAFMNIIGHGDNNYQLKTALPKLIVGIIIVPFTWFIVQFIVSISSILTASVIQLPYDIFKGSDTQASILKQVKIPNECTVDMSATGSGVTCNKDKVTTLDQMMNSKDSIGGVVAFYSFGLINIGHLTQLTSDQLSGGEIGSGIKSIFDLGLKVIVDITFVIAYLILLGAIALALFTRGIYLWLYTMFSPIFGLMYFFGKSLPSGMKKLEILTIPKLIGLAFVPVYVAAALSFGFIFLISAGHGLAGFTQDNDGAKTGGATTGSGFNIAGIQFNIVGASNKRDSAGSEGTTALSILGRGGDLVGQFLIQLFGIAILWMVVMAALSSSSITESVVKPIADFGTSIGKTVSKLPQYAPIFPGGQSAASMSTVGSNISGAFESAQNRKGTDFYNKTFGNGDKVTQKATEINPRIDNARGDIKQLSGLTQDLLKEVKDTQQLANSTQGIESLKKIATEMKIDKDKIDKVKLGDRESVANLLIEMDKNSERVGADIFNQKGNKLNGYASVDSAIKDLGNSYLIPKVDGDTTINLNNLTTVGINSNTNNGTTDYSIGDINAFSKHIKDNKSEFGGDSISKEGLKASLQKAGLNGKDDEIKIDAVINKLGDDFFKPETK
ncbi:MAG: hypothetical protein PHG82_00955 [Candidatus Gracilibacteria bacterium]|nr:hypothetical protein [Candidatus Gracilibacteria bacterium]